MSFLKKYAIGCVVLDLLWAVVMATFGAELMTKFGDIPPDSVAGGSGTILLFFAALFQGAIFTIVFSVFGFIGLVLYGKAPRPVQNGIKIALLLNLGWAALVATFAASILEYIGYHVGVVSGAASVLLWVIGFVAGYAQGLIFMTVLSGFAFVVILLVCLFFSGGSTDRSGRRFSDRYPGEPPHR